MRLRSFIPSSLALGILGVLFSLGAVIYTFASRPGCHARRAMPARTAPASMDDADSAHPCPMMRYEAAPDGTHGI
jgi:hypothetical protein